MADRRKEVKGIYSTWYECEEHGWTFGEEDERDNCPVCYGESLAEARIIKVLEELSCDECDMNGFENNIPNRAIALIKGEQKMTALEILKNIEKEIDQIGYNCRCDEGGVDAISVDLDWLQHWIWKAIEDLEK